MVFNQYKKGPNILLFVVYLIFGVYFINQPFQFFKLPESILGIEKWIIFIGGILILFGAINYFKVKRRAY